LKERPKYLKEVFLHGIRSKESAKQGGQNFFFARHCTLPQNQATRTDFSFMLLRNENRPNAGSIMNIPCRRICCYALPSEKNKSGKANTIRMLSDKPKSDNPQNNETALC